MKDMRVKQFLWKGKQSNVVMERKLNHFIHKEKDEQKMRKMCVTQKRRHAESHDV